MLTPISGGIASTQATPVVPSAAPSSTASTSRATAQDTVKISAAGQQASHAAADVDHDGDSH